MIVQLKNSLGVFMPLDLFEDFEIKYTHQFEDYKEIGGKTMPYTNKIKIPLTQRNRDLCGIPFDATYPIAHSVDGKVLYTDGTVAFNMSVDINRAIELIQEKQKADAPIGTYENLPIQKGVGRFGPFIKWNNIFINVNKKYDFDNLTQENLEELIEDKKRKEIEKVLHNWEDEGIRVEKARWGRSNILKGKIKIELPKTVDATKLTLEEVKDIIEKKAPKKKAPKKKTTKRKTTKK